MFPKTVLAALAVASVASAQTHTTCNPREKSKNKPKRNVS